MHRTALVALLSFVLAVPLLRRVIGGAEGQELVPVLAGTGRFELLYAALLALGLGAG
jgi:1,4-dihydroxy-2-naphthoate octaprenyltransferase